MKNKNGFTLVELLSVIVIIAIVATIGIFSSITIKDKMNKKMFETTLTEILTQATTFANDNKEEIEESSFPQTINSQSKKVFSMTVGNLKTVGYYKGDDESLISYKTGESISGAVLMLYQENSSGRMNACFADNTDNTTVLGDDDAHNEFGTLGIYCSKVSNLGGFTQIAVGINSTDWMKEKSMTLRFSNAASNIVGYKIAESKEECAADDSSWIPITGERNDVEITKKFTEEQDENGTKYYICVKDDGGQVTRTTKIVKKIDATKPTCKTVEGDWVRTNGQPTLAKAGCIDSLSGCKKTEFTKTYTIANNESATGFKVIIEDNAGNQETCDAKLKVDNIPPQCGTITGGSTTWSGGPVNTTVQCKDNESGCEQTSFYKSFTAAGKTGKVTIRDNAGNTTDCQVNTYIDGIAPTCSSTSGMPTSWTNSNKTIYQYCSDSESGCEKSSYSKSLTGRDDTITIKDKAGNATVCTYPDILIDKEKPVILKVTATNADMIYSDVGGTVIKNEKCTTATECSAEVHNRPVTSTTYFYSPDLSYSEKLSGVKLQNCDFNVYDTSWNEVYDKTFYFYSTSRVTQLGYARFTCTIDDNAGNTSSNKAIITYSIYIN